MAGRLGTSRSPAGSRSRSAEAPAASRRLRTFYDLITDRLRIRRSVSCVELHFIADDLEEHAWYVDLVADFVEDVEAFLAQLEEAR